MKETCENGSFIPLPLMFSHDAAYLRRPYSVTGFINQRGGGGAIRIFIKISALRQC